MRRLGWSLALMVWVLAQAGCASVMRPCGVEAPPAVPTVVGENSSTGEPAKWVTGPGAPVKSVRRPWLFDLTVWHPSHEIHHAFKSVLPPLPVSVAAGPASDAPKKAAASTSPIQLTGFESDQNKADQAPVIGTQLDDCCTHADRFSARVDYLFWWQRGTPVPPLITTSPDGTPRADAGVLGEPGTTILYGGERLSDDPLHGGRVTLGYWFNDERTLGIEGSYFMLEIDPLRFAARSDGNGSPILARPFFNDDPAVDAPAAQLISYPGAFAGAISVSGSSAFLGGDAYLRHTLCSGCGCVDPCNPCPSWRARVDLLGGYRYLRLRENLGVREDITSIDPESLIIVGTRIEVEDHFAVKNDFHGAEIGTIAVLGYGAFSLEGTAKLAFGVSQKRVSISGFNRVTVPGDETILGAGGLLAQPTNIGQYEDHSFTLAPELGLRVGYQMTDRLRATAGYSLIWWDHVVRPGDQIDLHVNATQLGGNPPIGPDRPAFEFHDSSYWVQGLTAGLELRF